MSHLNQETVTEAIAAFVLARLAEDRRRFDARELPLIDEAERHGRIRIMRSDDGTGLLAAADPVTAREQRAPVPFPEKEALLRQEIEQLGDENTLRLVASVYDTHPDWQESWRL